MLHYFWYISSNLRQVANKLIIYVTNKTLQLPDLSIINGAWETASNLNFQISDCLLCFNKNTDLKSIRCFYNRILHCWESCPQCLTKWKKSFNGVYNNIICIEKEQVFKMLMGVSLQDSIKNNIFSYLACNKYWLHLQYKMINMNILWSSSLQTFVSKLWWVGLW